MSHRPRVHVLHVPEADPIRDDIVARLRDEGRACVHADPDRHGCMTTWLAALSCAVEHDGDLDWTVILSDDADPLTGWQEHLPLACEFSPDPVLGLTHLGGVGAGILAHGAPYGRGPGLLWGGAIAYRRAFLVSLAPWAARVQTRTGSQHDDRLVAAYAMHTGGLPALTARALFGQPAISLLGHLGSDVGPIATITTATGPAWNATPRWARDNSGWSYALKSMSLEP